MIVELYFDTPGFCDPDPGNNFFHHQTYFDFIKDDVEVPIADIGATNPRKEWIEQNLGIKIESIEADFNFDSFNFQANTILFFEVLEHLVNPLWAMKQIANNMSTSTVLYLSTPYRFPFLIKEYNPHHFQEYPKWKLEKWLLQPLGLRVIEHKKIFGGVTVPARKWFSGIRPLLFRLPMWHLTGKWTNIYKIKLA